MHDANIAHLTNYNSARMLEKNETEANAGGLTREHVVWAYRLLLDRDPENEDVIGPKLAGSKDTRELRHHLMTSAEFLSKNRDYAHTHEPTIVIKEIMARGRSVRLFLHLSDRVIGLSVVRDGFESHGVGFVGSV